jgi:D-serine deaminase-like pyridoxal phosphate-dependent protein
MRIEQIDTPAIVVDLDKLRKNISGLQRYLDGHGISNRPHIKTHKIPEIAHMQVEAGAVGITCQKISEAEVMAQAGLNDIFIPYNIVGPRKLQRLVRLAQQVRLSVTADSEFVINGLSAAADAAGIILTVLVEFDTGAERCGVQSPREAAALAALIVARPSLTFGGLMTYPINEQSDPFVQETRALMKPEQAAVARVSVGSTAGMWQAHTFAQITEYRAGMYVYGDRNAMRSGAMDLPDCAMQVLATVVSRPTPDRGILDSGSKTLSSDLLGLEGYGMLPKYPSARLYALSEEHGHVDFSACNEKPEIGERVTVIPNHCCPVTNLFDEVHAVRGDRVEAVWQVAARGTVH